MGGKTWRPIKKLPQTSGQEIMLIKSGVEAPDNRSGFGEIFEAVKQTDCHLKSGERILGLVTLSKT